MNFIREGVKAIVLEVASGDFEGERVQSDWSEAYLRGDAYTDAAFSPGEHSRLAHLDRLIQALPADAEAACEEADRMADSFGWSVGDLHPFREVGLRALHTLGSRSAQWDMERTLPWEESGAEQLRQHVFPLLQEMLASPGALKESERAEVEVEAFVRLVVESVDGQSDDLIAMQHNSRWERVMEAARALLARLEPGWLPPREGDPAMPNPIGSWEEYFASMEDKPVHPLYFALDRFLPSEGEALEMAAGIGQGVRHLLDRGLDVWAFDAHGEPLSWLYEHVPGEQRARLHLRVGTFENLSLAPEGYDVVVAGFCLFFMSAETLALKWPTIVEAVRSGGLFAGQFLGVRDDWAAMGYTAQSREEVEGMLAGFEVLHFEEAERDGKTSQGTDKHWHVFHVIARKAWDSGPD